MKHVAGIELLTNYQSAKHYEFSTRKKKGSRINPAPKLKIRVSVG